jgi:hypothetical protein
LQFKLTDAEPLLYHNETVLRDGKIVGYLSSGNYGHHLGAAIGLGYVPCLGETESDLLSSSYEIDVAGTRVKPKLLSNQCMTLLALELKYKNLCEQNSIHRQNFSNCILHLVKRSTSEKVYSF